MLSFLNRKEIRVTRSAQEQYEICSKLECAGISTSVKTNSMTNPGRHHGVPGINSDYAYSYRIYVHRKEYERACYILRS